MNEASIGSRVQTLREERGWSRVELARRSGVSLSVINKMERGETQPRRQTLCNLAEALGTSAGYLRCGSQEDQA